MNPVIEIRNVNFNFGRLLVLKDINLSVQPGEFLGIIGPNAGGKSTLVKLILGLLEPDSGTIMLLGKDPELTRSRVGYVSQYPSFSRRDFPIDVEATVLMGRLGINNLLGSYTKYDRDIAHAAMEAVEIADIVHRPIGSLSGGQLQRTMIARALACQPEILIMDEPTANIDLQVEEDIFGLLKHHNENMTIIVVSHDIAFISGYVNRVACLNKELVCHTTDEISGKTIEELYGTSVRMIQHSH